jgi:hypothetical protein
LWLKRKSGFGSNKYIDFDDLRAQLQSHDISDKRGIYVFGLSGKKFVPWYIGRTHSTYAHRFASNEHRANEIGGMHGSIFFMAVYPKKGKGDARAIGDLEKDLIQDGYWINPKLINDRSTPKFRYKVEGVFPSRQGEARANRARDFRAVFKW